MTNLAITMKAYNHVYDKRMRGGEGRMIMQLIYARYNKYQNSIGVTTFNGYLLRIDCGMAEHGHRLKVRLIRSVL